MIFGYDFPDKVEYGKLPSGAIGYKSKELDEIWGHNDPDQAPSIIGEMTLESCKYVAGYILKKVTGPRAEEHYQRVDDLGFYTLPPEMARMSLKPGIGTEWYKKYKQDVYPNDYVIVKGTKLRPPRYYDKKLQAEDAWWWEEVQQNREEKAKPEENTPERLAVREQVAKANSGKFKRDKTS